MNTLGKISRLVAEHDGHGQYRIWATDPEGSRQIGRLVTFDEAAAIIRWWREGGLRELAALVDSRPASGDYECWADVVEVPDMSIVKQPRAAVTFDDVKVGPDLPDQHAVSVASWIGSI